MDRSVTPILMCRMGCGVVLGFERKDSQKLIDQAATNLSFLYFLEGDQKNAEKYAEMAVKADRYVRCELWRR
jgi:hypothetical protein